MDTQAMLIGAGLLLVGMTFGIVASILLIHETVTIIVKAVLEETDNDSEL